MAKATKSKKVTCSNCYDKIKHIVDKYVKRYGQSSCVQEDVKDLQKIVSLIKQRRFTAAASKMSELDTLLTDQFPQSVYNFVISYN